MVWYSNISVFFDSSLINKTAMYNASKHHLGKPALTGTFILVILINFLLVGQALADNVPEKKIGFPVGLEQLLSKIPPGKRVAVAEFTASNQVKDRLSAEIYQLMEPLAMRIGKEKGLQFVERRDLKLIIDEWKLSMSGITDGDAGARSLLDADYLLIGKVGLQDGQVRCSLKLTNLQNGEVVGLATAWRKAEPVYYKWAAQAEAAQAPRTTATNQATSRDNLLQLWTDAPGYEIGERMTIFFTVSKPLYVKIIDVTPAGEVMTIFPNPYQPDNHCKPGIRYQIPPPDADFALEVTPPTGTDRIKAVASEKPLPIQPEIRTRGIRFTRELIKSSPTRANIAFRIY